MINDVKERSETIVMYVPLVGQVDKIYKEKVLFV